MSQTANVSTELLCCGSAPCPQARLPGLKDVGPHPDLHGPPAAELPAAARERPVLDTNNGGAKHRKMDIHQTSLKTASNIWTYGRWRHRMCMFVNVGEKKHSSELEIARDWTQNCWNQEYSCCKSGFMGMQQLMWEAMHCIFSWNEIPIVGLEKNYSFSTKVSPNTCLVNQPAEARFGTPTR